MDNNKLYQHQPEKQEWDVDQSLFDHTPVKQGENSTPNLYSHNQENLSAENYDDLYNNSPNVRYTKSRKIEKRTNTLLSASAILISSVIGVVTIVNPLTMKPRVETNSCKIDGNILRYEVEVSNRLNYDCDLVLYLNGSEINRSSVDESKTYQGEYQINDSGNYELKFISTNNADYKNSVSLYTFNY